MALDPMIATPGPLRILTALTVEPGQEFIRLRHLTRLTDGHLTEHADALEGAGLITSDRSISAGKPVVRFTLTAKGRKAIDAHARHLMSALCISEDSEA